MGTGEIVKETQNLSVEKGRKEMSWYKVKYRLPANKGSKPETMAFRADNAAEAKKRVLEYYGRKCRGSYGELVIESVSYYASWDDVKESMEV